MRAVQMTGTECQGRHFWLAFWLVVSHRNPAQRASLLRLPIRNPPVIATVSAFSL